MEEKSRLIVEIEKLESNSDFEGIVMLLTDEVLDKYSDVELYSRKINCLIQLERFEQAEKVAKLGKSKYPDNPIFMGFLGDIFLKVGNSIKAKEFFDAALLLEPKDVHSLNGLALLYWKQHNYVEAEKCWLRVNAIDENNFLSIHALGNVYGVQEKYDKAKKYFLKALDFQPENSNVLSGLGNVFFSLFDFENAKKYYLKALDFDDSNFYSFNGLGNICLEEKDYEKAKEYFTNAIVVNKTVAAPFYNLGVALMGLHEYEEALVKFKDAKRIVERSDLTLIKQVDFKIDEVKKIISNEAYKQIKSLIDQVKEILIFKGQSVSHYTSLSVLQLLVLHNKPFRISEGSFLNDSSEGRVLFDYLNFKTQNHQEEVKHCVTFGKRPFIGSFVNETNDNDLPLWRMYGKEDAQEAKGCSVRINVVEFKRCIDELIRSKKIVKSNDFESITQIVANEGIDFYSVCYVDGKDFDFAGSNTVSKGELNQAMSKLREEIAALSSKSEIEENDDLEIDELLNQINFLFKNTIYKYENEVRIVVNNTIDFEIKLDIPNEDITPKKYPSKVFIELVSLVPLIKTITIGPKVEKSDEWAATFYYSLFNQGNFNSEMKISTLPFK